MGQRARRERHDEHPRVVPVVALSVLLGRHAPEYPGENRIPDSTAGHVLLLVYLRHLRPRAGDLDGVEAVALCVGTAGRVAEGEGNVRF